MNRTIQRGDRDAPIRGEESARIHALIAEATSDSQDESDEHAGLLSMIRQEVACPFRARVLNEEVECLRLEWPNRGYGLNAVCRTPEGKLQVVDIRMLEWVDPLPKGHLWIEAYLTWRDQLGS
jgi:hypothetical protein